MVRYHQSVPTISESQYKELYFPIRFPGRVTGAYVLPIPKTGMRLFYRKDMCSIMVFQLCWKSKASYILKVYNWPKTNFRPSRRSWSNNKTVLSLPHVPTGRLVTRYAQLTEWRLHTEETGQCALCISYLNWLTAKCRTRTTACLPGRLPYSVYSCNELVTVASHDNR